MIESYMSSEKIKKDNETSNAESIMSNSKPVCFAIEKDRRLFKCHYEACGRIFKEKGNLKTHIRIHTGERPYLCKFDGCGKTFITLGNLKSHQFNHTGDKLFRCSYDGCEKEYNRICRLKIHERTHSGFKPFQCPFPKCGKFFNEKGNLKTHYRIHTGEKPFKCRFEGCTLSFKAHGHLRDHMKRHLNLRPYECEVCHAKFARSSTLKVNFFTHSVKPSICPYLDCRKKFIDEESVTLHLKTHSELKIFMSQKVEQDNFDNDDKAKESEESLLHCDDRMPAKNNINNYKNDYNIQNNKETSFSAYCEKAKQVIQNLEDRTPKTLKESQNFTDDNSQGQMAPKQVLPAVNPVNNVISNEINFTQINSQPPLILQLNTIDKMSPLYLTLLSYFQVVFLNNPDMNTVTSVMNLSKSLNIPVESLLSFAYVYFISNKFHPITMNTYLVNLQKVVTFFNTSEFNFLKVVMLQQVANNNVNNSLFYNSSSDAKKQLGL